MAYLKPQSPLQDKASGDFFYPLTTEDQVILDNGNRLSGTNFLSVEKNSAAEGEIPLNNADLLGGYASSDYVLKTDAMVVTKNYSVVGGIDEPSNPTENMIWVQTENTVGKMHFSGVEPSSVNDNDIWIYTGDGSSVAFDAIKIGNDTMNTVYPISAKQYVGGVWVDKTAKSYQGGEWVDWWNGELFDNGNQFESVTGGWEHCYPYQGSVEIGEELSVNAPTGQSAGLTTKNKIKLTNYKKLCFNITYISSGKISLHISVNKEQLISDTVITQDANVTGVAQIDLTGVPDEAYIAFHAGNGRQAKVSKIWLE